MGENATKNIWADDTTAAKNQKYLDNIVKEFRSGKYDNITENADKIKEFNEFISSISSGFEKMEIMPCEGNRYNLNLAEWCVYIRVAIMGDMLFKLWLAHTMCEINEQTYFDMVYVIVSQYTKWYIDEYEEWQNITYEERGKYITNLFNDYQHITEKYSKDNSYVLTMKEFFIAFDGDKVLPKYVSKLAICGVEITQERLRRAKIAAAVQLCIPEKYIEINLLEE